MFNAYPNALLYKHFCCQGQALLRAGGKRPGRNGFRPRPFGWIRRIEGRLVGVASGRWTPQPEDAPCFAISAPNAPSHAPVKTANLLMTRVRLPPVSRLPAPPPAVSRPMPAQPDGAVPGADRPDAAHPNPASRTPTPIAGRPHVIGSRRNRDHFGLRRRWSLRDHCGGWGRLGRGSRRRGRGSLCLRLPVGGRRSRRRRLRGVGGWGLNWIDGLRLVNRLDPIDRDFHDPALDAAGGQSKHARERCGGGG